MICKNFDDIVDICRRSKIIFVKGELDRRVLPLVENGYNIYIINDSFSKDKIHNIIKEIKEENYGSYQKAE